MVCCCWLQCVWLCFSSDCVVSDCVVFDCFLSDYVVDYCCMLCLTVGFVWLYVVSVCCCVWLYVMSDCITSDLWPLPCVMFPPWLNKYITAQKKDNKIQIFYSMDGKVRIVTFFTLFKYSTVQYFNRINVDKIVSFQEKELQHCNQSFILLLTWHLYMPLKTDSLLALA